MKRPEQALQIACVKWFRYQHHDEILIHIPNGGYRTAIESLKFKQMGVLAGVPDLLLLKNSGKYGALFIEMKSGNGKLSDSQKSMIGRMESKGYKCEVASSFEEFKRIIEDYFKL